MSDPAQNTNSPRWPSHPRWRNGPWPNRRRSPVSQEMLVSAFEASVKSIATHEDVGWYEAHVVLDSAVVPPFRVFVQHHSVVDPPPDQQTAEWWPDSDRGEPLGALGDEAYVTASGGVVCRSGVRWTAGVLPLGREHTLPVAACEVLLHGVLLALADEGEITRWQTANAHRNYFALQAARVAQCQRRREQVRGVILSGAPPDELDAWLDAWQSRRRIRAANRVLLAAPVLALLSALSNPAQWFQNIAGMFLICAVVAGVVWLWLGVDHPRRWKKKLREQTWP